VRDQVSQTIWYTKQIMTYRQKNTNIINKRRQIISYDTNVKCSNVIDSKILINVTFLSYFTTARHILSQKSNYVQTFVYFTITLC
jgi:hypothetical protein